MSIRIVISIEPSGVLDHDSSGNKQQSQSLCSLSSLGQNTESRSNATAFTDVDYFSLRDPLPSKPLLRPIWVELIRRLKPQMFIEELYGHDVVTDVDREEIAHMPNRRDQAVALMSVMLRSHPNDVIRFAQIIRRTPELKDLGTCIIQNAGKGEMVSATATFGMPQFLILSIYL